MGQRSLNSEMIDYLDEYLSGGALDRFSVFVCRQDGVVLYKKDGIGLSVSHSSVGALLGGVWQAASTLASFLPESEKKEIFRLSFDTSSTGVYILPFQMKNNDYYLGLLYNDELNPGFIKNRLRDLMMRLEEYLAEFAEEARKEENDLLFENITDDEIEAIFAHTGI
ncbi:MAG: hypothetical protein EP319_08105 [Deltaproteobacteria bacterium]|nr:MAG: hypothetical protein EP319_08105 [Deltaproteobacteria bacterium]